MRIARAFYFLAAWFLAAFAFSAEAAQLVVVAGGAPGLKLGQVVESDASLDIPAGASVTLVSESGETVTLKGPHSGPPGLGGYGGDKGLVSSLSSLLAGSNRETGSLGVMRAISPKTPPDDPWVIDIGRSGPHCVAATGGVVLWRAEHKKARIISLKNLADKSRSITNWPAGRNTLNWPAEVSLQDGARYLVGMKGSRAKKKLTLHLVPATLPTDPHRAAWMAQKGCTVQAKRLLRHLR